ncbi:MAG: YbhB/YbcL family Raf kinase inhibitor-like protein [Candidatus Omnitrophica bacterium]|nr:YbhB/YbcL family Raf kinase inhibitor-like protein [Candidatus Omnitrophota bacterium]
MRIISFLLIFVFCAMNVFALEIRSSAFENGGYLPAKYTCDSVNVSPSFFWSDIPSKTKSFVLICDDPDAPYGNWTHWVVFNISADTVQLPEGIAKDTTLPLMAKQGMNDFGEVGYGGACPPAGNVHRYFFKLYALNTTLDLDDDANKDDVVEAMKGYIIAEAKIKGLYRR